MGKFVMIGLALASLVAEAKLELGAPFGNHAVLQRDREVRIWGKADPGAKVEVRFAGQMKTAVASADGVWRVSLDPMPASKEGRDLTVTEVKGKGEEVRSRDVLVGEVWICSGQSNCDCPVWGWNPRYRDGHGAMERQMTVKPFVRLAKVPKTAAAEPKADVSVRWREMTPKGGSDDISAVGWYFARELANALDIPIGLIDCSWGGSRIEPWTPRCGFASVEGLEKERDWRIIDRETHKANPRACPYAWDNQPSMMWNGMVAALAPMSVRGLIWYQGCANAGLHAVYTQMLHALYNGWSEAFENPSLRMYLAQLAPWGNAVIPHIQEAQARFAAEEPNAAIAVINDVGNLHDIHPNDKRTVAKRLALHALKRDYGFDWIRDNSPTLRSWRVEDGNFVLEFDDVDSWYVYNADRSVEMGFEVCGTNGQWQAARLRNLIPSTLRNGEVWYNGTVKGRDLVVGSDEVARPVKLRYLHSKPWFGCLYNEVCLPLGAFHVDAPNPRDAAWDYVAERLYSPRTHLLYEYRTGGTNGVVGLQPTVEEIARNYPNGAGWHTGMDDGPQLNGPMLLAALGRWERTHEASVAEFAHDLFRGLRLCAEVSEVPGFLARSVSPRDGKSHYVQSSRDQYTYFVYALWRYWQSPLATPEERDDVRRMLVDVARYAERVVTPENRYSFLREDGGPALYQEMWTDDLKPTRNEKTGIDVFGGLCAHEAMRLPMIYAAAWAVSGDAHWRELEVRYVDAGLHMTQGLLPKGLHGFALVQMQLSHRLLWEVEPDAARKSRIAATFARVPALAANLHESVCRNFKDLGGDFSARIGDWRKYPMETPVDGPADGVIGGIRYLTPQWPERFAKAAWCLREAGEVVSAMKLCPDGTVPAAYRETLERCFASVDYGSHFTSGPVHLLMAQWLPEGTAERTNLVFGVVSDIHVSAEGGDLGWAGDASFFERTLRWYREQDVDAIVIPGDLANFGLVEELEEVAAAWYRVFPDDTGRDGRHVEKLFVMGNHDAVGFKYGPFVRTRYPDEAERHRRTIAADPKAVWERCFHEPFAPIWEKTVRGYRFIGAHWLTGANVDGLDEFLSARRDALGSGRPFFYIQHAHPMGTCYGPWAWGHDDGRSTTALSRFPNAVVFSGHSHYTLMDPRTVWQGAFTSVGCSSLRYLTENYDEFPPDGFENGGASGPCDTKGRVMPDFRRWDRKEGRQGLLVRVYSDRMELVRRDFSDGVSLGPDWVVPFNGSKPFAPEAWGAGSCPPQFPAGARLQMRALTAQDRRDETVSALELSFPAAVSGGRVHHYDVYDGKGGRLARILSEDYFKASNCENGTVTCRVRCKSSEVHSCRVVPVGWTGQEGLPLSSP